MMAIKTIEQLETELMEAHLGSMKDLRQFEAERKKQEVIKLAKELVGFPWDAGSTYLWNPRHARDAAELIVKHLGYPQ